MPNQDLYLSADEAARALEISIPTLYAYVSRKMVRSERMEGSRARRYWRADIDKLLGKQTAHGSGYPQTPLATETAITLITEGGLFFRGQDVVALARHSSIESLAALLWQADEGPLFGGPVPQTPRVWAELRPTLAGLCVQERAMTLFPIVERANARAYDLSPIGYARTGADVLRWYATLLTHAPALPHQPIHQFLAQTLKAPDGFDEVIRTTLVLSADHEFDPITYAVRAVANVGVTAYQAVVTGLMASNGQRFQAERVGSVARFLKEILASNDSQAVVVQRLRSGGSLPGFTSGHKPVDPRTGALMAALQTVLHADPQFLRLQAAQRVAMDASGAVMDYIVAALFVGHYLGFAGEELAVSALGRMVGWIAHAMEQFHQHDLVRPGASYTGLLPNGAV